MTALFPREKIPSQFEIPFLKEYSRVHVVRVCFSRLFTLETAGRVKWFKEDTSCTIHEVYFASTTECCMKFWRLLR